jgi:hypothetical protein
VRKGDPHRASDCLRMAFQMSNTTTYGLEQVLRQNILNSDYYNNTCLELTTWVMRSAVCVAIGFTAEPHLTLLFLACLQMGRGCGRDLRERGPCRALDERGGSRAINRLLPAPQAVYSEHPSQGRACIDRPQGLPIYQSGERGLAS